MPAETHIASTKRGLKTDRLLRVLLNNPNGNLTKYRIARLSDMQPIHTSVFLRQLESKKLVRGTKVIDYRGLIVDWSKREIEFPIHRYMLKSIMDFLRKTDLKYALTTYQAETLINGYLFPTKIELYIRESDFDLWHNALVKSGARVGGGNVVLRMYDDGVFYNFFKTREGYSIVSIPQLIVDLVREGGVAMQAAEMLIEKERKMVSMMHVMKK
ncbi:MAG: hypothetical protein ACYCQJ_01865 [Nitrososphaerales archaeon]